MQCSNCQFENMPGMTTCGRCGATLQLDSAVMDVHPPRAGRLAKRWRRWFPLTRYWNRLFHSEIFDRVRRAGWPADLHRPGVLLRMIIPGWAQHYLGRMIRAQWMFWSYCALLFLGVLFIGTLLGWLLLGLAVSLHAASIVDIVAADVGEFHRRLIYSCAAVILLAGLIYYPIGHLVALVAVPQQFNLNAPPFESGDVVLVNPSAFRSSDPQPGDVVIYTLPSRDIHMQDSQRHHVLYRLQGDRVDRIIAQGSQRVTYEHGRLLVNGRPSPWQPLSTQPLPENLDLTVPSGAYLIPPGTAPGSNIIPQEVWRAICIVPRDRIGGRVYWQTQPLWRFGPIR